MDKKQMAAQARDLLRQLADALSDDQVLGIDIDSGNPQAEAIAEKLEKLSDDAIQQFGFVP